MPPMNSEISGNEHQKHGNDTKLTEIEQKINHNECEIRPSHDRIHQRQPLTDANVMNSSRSPCNRGHINVEYSSKPMKSPLRVQNQKRQPLTDANVNTSAPYSTQYASYNSTGGALPGRTHGENTNSNILLCPAIMQHRYAGNRIPLPTSWSRPSSSMIEASIAKQPCRYYAQGRCYYGHRCKWLH